MAADRRRLRQRLRLVGAALARCTTARARALLAAGIVLLGGGVAIGSTDLMRVGLLVVSLPLVALAVATRTRLQIGCARHSEPGVAVVGSTVEVVLTLTNRSLLSTGTLQLEDQMPPHLAGKARFALAGLRPQESRSVVYRLTDVRRGRFTTGPLRIDITDAFGLVELVRDFSGHSELVVTPQFEALTGPTLAQARDAGDSAGWYAVAGNGAQDYSIREYRFGDDRRKIHWRSTARVGAPMVRMDERPWHGRATVMLDVRRAGHALAPAPTAEEGPNTDPRQRDSLEWAVSAAGSVAVHMLAAGRDTGLVVEGPSSAGPMREPMLSARQVALRLAELPASNRPALARLLPALHRAARDSTVTAVLGELDPTSLAALVHLAIHSGARPGTLVAVILDVSSWRCDLAAAQYRRPDQPPNRNADTAAARLASAGWAVAIARRGDSVAQAWNRLVVNGPTAAVRDEPGPRTPWQRPVWLS